MGWHRPRAIVGPNLDPRDAHHCSTWRSLTLLAAALLAVIPATAAAAAHPDAATRRHRGRAVPATAGFVAPASSAAVWASFRRQRHSHHAWNDLVGSTSAVSGAHCARCSSSSGVGGCLAAHLGPARLHQRQQHRQQLSETRFLQTTTSRRVSLQPTDVVGVGVNASTSASPSLSSSGSAPSGARKKQSVEGAEATVILTAAGGRPHTDDSRAKISAANKGKKPWNKGGRHSEETRRKIAEGARKNALKRKEATAQSLGMTLEEYSEMKDRRRKTTGRNPEVSEETRLKISTRLKERWRDPAYRERRKSCMPNRMGVPHSEDTKARIAAAVRLRWQDPEYREKITSRVSTEETRAKIGQVIRDQWADPEIRKERMSKIKPKTEEHKKRISDAVKSKWADPEFRKRTQEKMRAAAHSRIIAMGGVPRPPRERRERRPRSPEAAAAAEARKMNSMARNQANFISRQERLARTAEAKMEREAKREEKKELAATKLMLKEARLEAERLAQEEEDRAVEGLDELEMVLRRQELRTKKMNRMAKLAKAAKQAEEEAMPKREEPPEPIDKVPDGFELVEMNGRKILRMK